MLGRSVMRAFSAAQQVNNFAVVGGGQMGTGIAIVAANSGKLNTQILCENDKAAGVCKAFVEAWIDKELKKNKTDEQGKQDFLKRISYVTDIQELKNNDFIVEAVYENFDLKKY
jgi:3-hydroxyacyl-CoA dehydrogenase